MNDSEIDTQIAAALAALDVTREQFDDLRATLLRSDPAWPGANWQPKSARDFAPFIDHTVLKPDATESDIDRLCDEARAMKFVSVCVNSCHVKRCVARLAGADVMVCSVTGFPLGASATEIKRAETEYVVDNGAREVDMVINVGWLRSGVGALGMVRDEIQQVVEGAWGNPVKVILETCLLEPEEIVRACVASVVAGAAFVKTSTGFSRGGARAEDVALMRRVVGPNVGVKASGGIRHAETALAMIRAGANRLGTSSGMAIVGSGLEDQGGRSGY